MKRQFLKRSLLLSTAVATAALIGYARQPERGYRGFVDWTNLIYKKAGYDFKRTYYDPGISTSHGYQFNPWLFAGAGIDFGLKDTGWWSSPTQHHYSLENYRLSLFAEGRTDLQFGKLTPFADIRLGWNACETGTIYFSPTVGYRFNWGRKVGINVGIGYTLDAYRYEDFIFGTTTEGWPIFVPTGKHVSWQQSSFTFRVGFDF